MALKYILYYPRKMHAKHRTRLEVTAAEMRVVRCVVIIVCLINLIYTPFYISGRSI